MPRTSRASAESNDSAGESLLATFDTLRSELSKSLYFLLGNESDVQDALQIGFLHCWRARAKLSRVTNVRAWIYRVCLNAGRDMRDNAWRRRARPLDAATNAWCREGPPARSLIAEEEREQLQAALCRLRPEEKEIFCLRQQGELTFEQIAELRGRPVATGKSLMRSALRKLQRMVCEDFRSSSSLLAGAAQ